MIVKLGKSKIMSNNNKNENNTKNTDNRKPLPTANIIGDRKEIFDLNIRKEKNN